MPDKSKGSARTVSFRGEEFAYDPAAVSSLMVQSAIVLATRRESYGPEFVDAMDKIFRGRLLDVMARVPDADGKAPGPLGCSGEDLGALYAAVMQQAGATAKN